MLLHRERFHPFTPGQHLTYRIPPINPDWYTKYNPFLKIGERLSAERCSTNDITASDAGCDSIRLIFDAYRLLQVSSVVPQRVFRFTTAR